MVYQQICPATEPKKKRGKKKSITIGWRKGPTNEREIDIFVLGYYKKIGTSKITDLHCFLPP